MKVLVAGASGLIGREVLPLLKEHGHLVRTLSRDVTRARALAAVADEVRVADATVEGALHGLCDGVEVVVSALGAPVSSASPERRTFAEVDERANLALLEEAKRAGVRRFVYVGVYTGPAYADTRYVQAHARVERAAWASGLAFGVVRPTGVFGALAELLDLARKGALPVIAGGAARTNPVHEQEVAQAVVRAAEASGPTELDLGGPEVLTRRELAELAFKAVGKAPRLVPVPAWAMEAAAAGYGMVNPRMGEFLRFVNRVSTVDCVAPLAGALRLQAYLEAAARR